MHVRDAWMKNVRYVHVAMAWMHACMHVRLHAYGCLRCSPSRYERRMDRAFFAVAIAISRGAKLRRYSSSASAGLYGYPVLKSATGFQTFAQDAIERYVLSLALPRQVWLRHSSSLPFADQRDLMFVQTFREFIEIDKMEWQSGSPLWVSVPWHST
jgi:hypothetical protein